MIKLNEKFTILVEIPGEIIEREDYSTTVEVNLLDPEFEKTVLSAAGRIMSLRRKSKKGGRKRQ
jgi:hypothetical protein